MGVHQRAKAETAQGVPLHLFEVNDGLATLILNAPPVNALSRDMREAIVEAVHRAAAQPEIAALIIRCAGKTFIAGADIREFGRPAEPPSLPDVIDAIEACPKPVIAAIHGTALGGGLELAMACRARVATADAKLGLPEVKLGLMPGAGGTQRLPRLIGVREALEMMVGGAAIDAAKAHDQGLIDEVAEGDLSAAVEQLARRVIERPQAFVPARKREDRLVDARQDPSLFDRFLVERRRSIRGFDAPLAIVEAVRRAVDLPFEEAIAEDRSAFLRLRDGRQSAALRYLFFAERDAAKVDGIEGVPAAAIRRVCIVGAGTMGRGIATAFLVAGFDVSIADSNEAMLAQGAEVVRASILKDVSVGRLDPDIAAASLRGFTLTSDLADLANCQLIIEAVYESLEVKTELFAKLDRIASDEAILATNTSYLSVDDIAAATARPDRVIGLHFFSPANVMRLVEIVRAPRTSDVALATALHIAKRLAKVAVVTRDAYGFIGNRMLAVRRREADRLILEGASPWQIDRTMVDFGMPMGPFQISDLAGLDLGWTAGTSTGATIRELLCEHGRRGQKTAAGFYDYDARRTPTPSPVTEALIAELAAKNGVAQRKIGDEEIVERLIYPMINEGARILEDWVAARVSDIDVVWANGYGWPRYRGGPMHHAEAVGLPHIVARLREYAARLGENFAPATLLVECAERGKSLRMAS